MAAIPQFRTCPNTGLKIESAAAKLIKVNVVTALVFLFVGGLFGVLLALTRWPGLHLLPADLFYLALTAHGFDALLVWILFFEVALLYFASAVLLNCRLATPRVAWVSYVMMLFGAVMTNVMVLMGESSVMFTSYVPLKADPLFYLGIIIFAVGVLLACGVFFGTLVVAKDEKTYKGSIPLVTFGALTAAIIGVFTVASGAVILIPTFVWSLDLGIISYIDPMIYKVVWWAMGHGSQQINVSLHVAVWYAIAAMVLGAKPLSEKVSRSAFLMYILFLQLAAVHHLLVDPGLSSEYKIFNTSYAMYLAVLGSMIHGLTVPGSIEAAQRKKGFNKGLFEWLRKAPWGNPAFSGMFMSLIFFGFLGGITGVIMGSEQINLIIHNTVYVVGHFHATVVTGTTLAFMAMTYLLIPLVFQRELVFKKLAQWQPYVYGIGMALVSVLLMGAGTLGVARRHWDITFADATLSFEYPATAYMLMAFNGMAALIAAVGGFSFILIVVGSILYGKKIDKASTQAPVQVVSAQAAVASYGSAEDIKVPGTFILALFFMVVFVLYYFVNWKYLAGTWGLS